VLRARRDRVCACHRNRSRTMPLARSSLTSVKRDPAILIVQAAEPRISRVTREQRGRGDDGKRDGAITLAAWPKKCTSSVTEPRPTVRVHDSAEQPLRNDVSRALSAS